jgi:UDP-N-acetylenolpyruvoylglucosamine reductase
MFSRLHANFWGAAAAATAGATRALFARARDGVSRHSGVVLRDEIVFLGEW